MGTHVIQAITVLLAGVVAYAAFFDYREKRTFRSKVQATAAALACVLGIANWVWQSMAANDLERRERALVAKMEEMQPLRQRELSSAQRASILRGLKGTQGELILVMNKSKESQVYAEAFGDLFKVSGWLVTLMEYDSLSRTPKPFAVSIHPKKRSDSFIRKVLAGLDEAGFNARPTYDESGDMLIDVGVVRASSVQAAQDATY